jgi:integrase
VSEAAEAYIAYHNRERRSGWTGQTHGQARTTFRLFREFTRDAPLEAITRNDIADFLSTLSLLDPNYGRRSAGKGLSLKELLDKYPAKDRDGIGNRTLNRHVAVIAGMFEWAIKAGKIAGPNPAKGHHQTETPHETDAEGARRLFTTDELKKLLKGPLFAISYAKRTEPARHTVETALAWLIPIALYSGMRLDEICGLRAADVMNDEGILYFDLRSHEGRRLKTAAARRRIPVHSELMRIGFGSYLVHVRRQGHEYLFPALKPGGPDGKRSWYVSKRFTTYRRAVGVSASETVFHCFRKNAATALERARVPENEAVQVLGHKKLTMSYGLYSGGLDLAGLVRVVEAINYPGLDLSALSG